MVSSGGRFAPTVSNHEASAPPFRATPSWFETVNAKYSPKLTLKAISRTASKETQPE